MAAATSKAHFQTGSTHEQSAVSQARKATRPRPITETERVAIEPFLEKVHYSPRYADDNFEYRHVMLPKEMLKVIPKDYFDTETGTLRILHEEEWRSLGITQSVGWTHYEIHVPEPHILLFKREKDFQSKYSHPQQR